MNYKVKEDMTKKTHGFSVIVVILFLTSIVLIAVIAWRILSVPTTTPIQTQNSSGSKIGTTVKSEDGLVEFLLPTNWELVNKTDTSSRSCQVGFIAQEISGPCTMLVNIKPKSLTGESKWSIRVDKTKKTAMEWASYYPLGNLEDAPGHTFTNKTQEKINGQESFYVKVNDTSYEDINYFIKHNDLIVYANAREKFNNGEKLIDYTKYSKDFDSIVRSIKFN